ncbi:MAG: head GIN domain-containing protein [Leeuwenhoekiella sp.]
MRIFFYFLSALLFFSCDSENVSNCVQEAGERVEQEYELASFNSIIVEERLQLILKQGPQQKVVVQTGKNLLGDIEASVTDGILTVYNTNGCNLVRDYNITQVIVTSPDIKNVRNASGYEVQSDGVLSYNSLTLVSEDLEEEDKYHKDGDFRLELAVDSLKIVANGLSNFFLSGTAQNADIELLEGDMRVEAQDLAIENLYIFHRGTQKVIINPIQSLRGRVLSTGDLISVNRPPIVEVEETYTGKLIFE